MARPVTPLDVPIGLTIFLLKTDQVNEFEKVFGPQHPQATVLNGAHGLNGHFIPLPSSPTTPKWARAITDLLGPPGVASLHAQSPGGLLVVREEPRTFVVTFGYAWQKLEADWKEADFGRRVALNTIDPDSLVEIRSEQVFAKWHFASDRAPRATTVDEFGVEFDRDLVATIEGVPRHKSLGKTVRGGTSLRLNLPLAGLAEVLKRSDGWFRSNQYRTRWPDIDNLTPVRERALTAQLEARLDEDLRSGVAQKKLVLFTPFYRDDAITVDSYVVGRKTDTAPTRPYLTVGAWTDYLDRHGLSPSVLEARHTPIHLVEEASEAPKKCSIFECFGYEVSLNKRQYVLSSGIWYQVELDFLNRVKSTVEAIEPPPVKLPAWDPVESEPAYNKRCAAGVGLLGFDAKNVWFGGGQSKFEFCDLLHPQSQTMYFVKMVSKSSGMSHLVEQVRRTSELVFSADVAFRAKLKAKFAALHKEADASWLDSRPRHSDWALCLISLGQRVTDLPFFAKCSLVKLHKDMVARGHRVYFGNV